MSRTRQELPHTKANGVQQRMQSERTPTTVVFQKAAGLVSLVRASMYSTISNRL
jgi:hypothetical protein